MVDKTAKVAYTTEAKTTETRGFLLFSTNAGGQTSYNPTQNCRAKYPLSGGLKNPVGCLSGIRQTWQGVFFLSPQNNQVKRNGTECNEHSPRKSSCSTCEGGMNCDSFYPTA